jgi:hypothetical protein
MTTPLAPIPMTPEQLAAQRKPIHDLIKGKL